MLPLSDFRGSIWRRSVSAAISQTGGRVQVGVFCWDVRQRHLNRQVPEMGNTGAPGVRQSWLPGSASPRGAAAGRQATGIQRRWQELHLTRGPKDLGQVVYNAVEQSRNTGMGLLFCSLNQNGPSVMGQWVDLLSMTGRVDIPVTSRSLKYRKGWKQASQWVVSHHPLRILWALTSVDSGCDGTIRDYYAHFQWDVASIPLQLAVPLFQLWFLLRQIALILCRLKYWKPGEVKRGKSRCI